MNMRLPFLKWRPLEFGLVLLTLIVLGVIGFGLYYHTFKTILALLVVIIGVLIAGILNKTADDIERAKRAHRPPGPNEILSFSLEKEMPKKDK